MWCKLLFPVSNGLQLVANVRQEHKQYSHFSDDYRWELSGLQRRAGENCGHECLLGAKENYNFSSWFLRMFPDLPATLKHLWSELHIVLLPSSWNADCSLPPVCVCMYACVFVHVYACTYVCVSHMAFISMPHSANLSGLLLSIVPTLCLILSQNILAWLNSTKRSKIKGIRKKVALWNIIPVRIDIQVIFLNLSISLLSTLFSLWWILSTLIYYPQYEAGEARTMCCQNKNEGCPVIDHIYIPRKRNNCNLAWPLEHEKWKIKK